MAADLITAVLAYGWSASQPFGSQVTRSSEQIRRKLLEFGEEAVVEQLQQHIQEQSAQACKALNAILQVTRTSAVSASLAPSDAAACNRLRSTLCEQLAAWVHGLPADAQQTASDLVSAFSSEVDDLPADDLKSLISSMLMGMEQALPHSCTLLELLPACLSALSTAADAASDAGPPPQQHGNGSQPTSTAPTETAAQHVQAAIHRLQQCKEWKPEHLGQLLLTIKDLPTSQQQLHDFIKKAVNTCRAASLQELPSILYQLLRLSVGSAGTRSFALQQVLRLFKQLERKSENQVAASKGSDNAMPSAILLQVQATVLMHISTLLKYQAALGSEWLKWLKAEGPKDSHFLLQVAFAMMRQRNLEQPVQQLLKSCIMRACEDEALNGCDGSSSRWLASLPAVDKGPSLQQLEATLLKTVRCSTHASELVSPGLMQLASALLASSSKACPLHIVMAAQQGRGAKLPQQASAAARAVRLGLVLLQEVFDTHAEARPEVLKLCQGQLSCYGLPAALPLVLLLSSICREQPALLSSYTPQLKECLASFAGLSVDAVLVLLVALWPMCRVRRDLQDHVIMLLRKMMYRQVAGGRLLAIRGFLCLILQQLSDTPTPAAALQACSFSQASSSQASLSQLSSLSGGGGVNLLQELAGVLRRALSQQAPVRQVLYKGLMQVLQADPNSQELLSELLLPHLHSYMLDDSQQLPPLLLQRCAELQHGEAVLVEPLPALLSCVLHLSEAQAQRQGTPAGSDGWGGGHTDAADEIDPQGMTLQACFNSIRHRLAQCTVEVFDLGLAADLSPLVPEGQLGQLHASNLLGCIEVVMEAVLGDIQQLKVEQPDSDKRNGDQVKRLGEELLKLFQLHQQVYSLACEGCKAGSRKGGKKKTAGESTEPQPPTAGQKRASPGSSFTPPSKRAPQMSATCLASLCDAIVEDGLMQLPNDCDDTSSPNYHTQLARNPGFRAFVLRGCANVLEGVHSTAAAAALLQMGSKELGTGSAAAEVLQLGPSLFKVAKLVMDTAVQGGRATGSTSNGAVGPADSHESIEQLSANALLQLLKLADSTQQLVPLFKQLPLESGFAPANKAAAAADSDNPTSAAAAATETNTAAAVAAAVLPRLPQLEKCLDRLMQNGCFKEAHIGVECLVLLGRRLGAPAPIAAGGTSSSSAFAELSKWAETALQQDEPEVKSVPLAKALLDMYIRFHGTDDMVPLMAAAKEIQALVGDTEQETQETQQHGTVLPMLTGTRTAQPAAAAVLAYIDESLGQLERLLVASLKQGVVQEGQSPDNDASKSRAKLAAASCKRFQALLECCDVLVNTILAMPAIMDQQTKVLAHAYKVLAMLAKAYQLPRGNTGGKLSQEFESIVSYVNKSLTVDLYKSLTDTLATAQESKQLNTLTRVKREAKLVPTLIYSIEAWEKQLVVTGKAAAKNLLKDAKRSTCRDFKFNLNTDGVPHAGAGAGGAAAKGGSQIQGEAKAGTSRKRQSSGAAASSGSARSRGTTGSQSHSNHSGQRSHSSHGAVAGSGQDGQEEDGEAMDEDVGHDGGEGRDDEVLEDEQGDEDYGDDENADPAAMHGSEAHGGPGGKGTCMAIDLQ